MKSLDDEDYLFLRLCSLDLDKARYSLDVLDRVSDGDVRVCIHRDIIVTYARPFSGNRGRAKKHRLHELLPNVVPTKHEALHTKLIRFRNELFAHTDMSAYNPQPVKWERASGTSWPMTFWELSYDVLEAQLAELREIVESVETTVNDEIARIHSTL